MAMTLRGMLNRSYSVITKNLSEGNTNPWLRDNFYIIDRHYRLLRADKKLFGFTEMYKLLGTYCENRDYRADPKALISYLLAQSRRFGYYELCALKGLLAVNAINKIGEMLRNKSTVLLPDTVKLLISLSDPGFDDIPQALWAPEKIISKYEKSYDRFDSETKAQYRRFVADYSKRHSIDESDAAKELITEAKRRNCPLGALIFRPKKKYTAIWILSVAVIFTLLTATGFFTVGYVSFILTVPFAMAAVSVSDLIISFIAPAYRAPRIRLDTVPENAKTLVAVASLMSGSKNDEKGFDALVRFRYMNPDKNIYFCLLADLPDSSEQYHLSDSEIINSARQRIDELNRLHGDRFCIFFRERVLNKSENRYGGWERKRGAVCELVSHIMKGNKTEYYGGDFIRDIKYLLTLDGDTNLSVESVRELLSVALHPANRPEIKNGRVVSGYGIIQPTIRTELKSAYKTGFSRLTSGVGGSDVYATAAFHRSQTLFGSGNFCGKGLIDVSLFHSFVEGKLPEGLVLSHDSIEGSILRTACVSDIILTDSTPANTVSFFRRHHRWMRGDFQNLYFLKGKLLTPFYKWRLFLTVCRHASPIFSLLAVIAGCFIKNTSGLALFLLAYSEFLLPCVFTALQFLFSGSPFAAVRFFSKAYSLITQTFIRLTFEISSSARRATLTLHAYFLAAVRLFTRQKTLEWTTAAQTEKLSSSLGKYVLDSISSVIIGLSMLIFALPPFMRFCGLIYFIYPLISAVLSLPISGGAETKPVLTEKQKELLAVHAKDMFGFYYDNVNAKTNHLPPDNIQFSPVASTAMRTSPTNIGFYLVSLLAGRDLGIIDSEELYSRLDDSLGTIERLEKYRGNLYNWYDISNLSVIGEGFVSTVDSGNFIVMLSALKEGLKEYSKDEPRLEDIIDRCRSLIGEADLMPLYDSRRELFKIGIKPDSDDSEIGCYDLLMSEARMTGYYAVAKGIVPKKHWANLGRTLTHRNGYIGMMSWSGTAFEYLMPQLFLPLYRDSFMFESVAFSLMLQKEIRPVWGISESGFYSFDSEMNYQYKANGLQDLALRRIASDEFIISPYSTYLSLCILGNSAIKNLRSLETKGMYGKYGLYEALDFNNGSGGLTVKSYMAHHVGMSIIAVMNAIKDNVFVHRFMGDIKMESAKELLQEKIPIGAHVFEDEHRRPKEERRKSLSLSHKTESIDLNSPRTALLSRGDASAVISSNGHILFRSGERVLSNTVFDKFSLRFSPAVIFTRGKKAYGCTPLFGGGSNYSFEKGNDFAAHIASGKDFSARVKYSIAKNCNCFVINTRGESLKKYDVSFVFEPVLESEKKFRAHISFSRLFIESEYDKSKRILYFHRRSSQDGSHVFTLAVAPRDKDMSFSFLTSRENIKASSISSPIDYAFCEADNITGECIDPICMVKCENAEGGRATFLVSCGETKSECERNIRLARMSKGDYPLPQWNETSDRLLPSLFYGRGVSLTEKFTNCGINDLWGKSISGDYPMAVIFLPHKAVTRTEEIIKAFLTLFNAFIQSELIFITDDTDKYNRPIEGSVRDCCARLGASQYIGRRKGIFILRKGEISEDLFTALRQSAHFYLDSGNDIPENPPKKSNPDIVASPQKASPLPTPEKGWRAGYGYFFSDSYTVDKSSLPDAPYSFILTGYRFSTVLTQSSLGYTFFDNARERRLCSFFGDPRSVDGGERIFLIHEGKRYDLCAVSNKTVFEKGKAVYYGEIGDNRYTVTVVIPPKYPVKLIRIRTEKPSETEFSIQPVMGDSVAPVNGIEVMPFCEGGNSCIMLRNPFGMTFPEGRGFAGVHGGTANAAECTLMASGTDAIYFLGACMTEGGAKSISGRIGKGFYETALKETLDFVQALIPKISVNTENTPSDILFNFFLPYQVSACRFYARGSFYQSGGAYGFRDQLQDSLALIYSNPKAVRTHIIRCAAHQYEEGCVMHWWHTRHFDRVNRGIKSKCSDDLLYLPIVTADYIEKTGDRTVIDVPVHYLRSKPLEEESERYEQPEISNIKESVYLHCIKALDFGYKVGKNGFLLMGSCDWNDAFSLVGEHGKGESIFTTLLYILALRAFIPVMEEKGDTEKADRYRERAEILHNAVEQRGFFGDRYARAVCDDGEILGIEDSEECKIDILSQAFAAMAGLDSERVKTALNTAVSRLYDGENHIMKLFSPPFKNGKARVGYIRGYVAGIRENGGQYTHGALWGALGCFTADMKEEGLKILDCANPVTRYADRALGNKYKTEPYAVAADIYSGKFGGRGGWSWYTGAAAWLYRISLEYVYGIKLGGNQTLLSAKPIIPYTAEIQTGDATIHVFAAENITAPKLDGKVISFPIQIPKGRHILELPITQ